MTDNKKQVLDDRLLKKVAGGVDADPARAGDVAWHDGGVGEAVLHELGRLELHLVLQSRRIAERESFIELFLAYTILSLERIKL